MTYTSLLLTQNLRILNIHLLHRDGLRVKLRQYFPLSESRGDGLPCRPIPHGGIFRTNLAQSSHRDV